MRFLLKLFFWGGLVLLLLPLNVSNSSGDADPIGPLQTLTAARDAASDFAAICDRQPDACAIGRQALTTMGVRAREGARLAYEMLDEKFGEPDTTLQTGSVTPETQADSVAADAQ